MLREDKKMYKAIASVVALVVAITVLWAVRMPDKTEGIIMQKIKRSPMVLTITDKKGTTAYYYEESYKLMLKVDTELVEVYVDKPTYDAAELTEPYRMKEGDKLTIEPYYEKRY